MSFLPMEGQAHERTDRQTKYVKLIVTWNLFEIFGGQKIDYDRLSTCTTIWFRK